MAPYASDDTRGTAPDENPRARRRKAVRYVVPVAVTGVAAATIGLVPALADTGDPDLPKISAQQLVEKIARSDVQRLSGTVKISTDLGLPDLGGLENGLGSGSGGHDGSSADPSSKLTELASGTHTLRVAADGPDKQKLSLRERGAEYSLIHNGKDVWGYDSGSNEVFHGTAEQHGKEREDDRHGTPQDFAENALKAVDDTTSVTVGGTERVAGRDAYKLLIKPKQQGSTVGAVTIAVDAKTGTPLKFTLTAKSGGKPVVDTGFTQVSFAKPAASTFDFTPPKGAKVTEEKDSGKREHAGGPGALFGGAAEGGKVIGKGWTSVATFDTGAKGGMPSGSAGGFLGSLGDQVTGDFGKGTVFSTRLVNALITDDGKVYAGAVTKQTLLKTADAEN
ncbi:LolA family protein [Streptomyces sp. LaPpAH-108]|uniref:LolA family protein n=1 Tax=Streptomyces sp. LaPpAH-108 TaxID=1155714 RepID=UPI00035FED64|nr:outer membrane lipoprotein carrier protein LolA [Streptomyces sp. LaPpAH-108]